MDGGETASLASCNAAFLAGLTRPSGNLVLAISCQRQKSFCARARFIAASTRRQAFLPFGITGISIQTKNSACEEKFLARACVWRFRHTCSRVNPSS